jgi:sulfur carrier protein ThiS
VKQNGEVEFTLVGLLKKYGPAHASVVVEPNETVVEAIRKLNLDPDLVAIVMVNGRQRSKGDTLTPGDKVKLLPIVGGG